MVKETCPHCGHILRFEDSYAGEPVNCDRCGGAIVLPGTPRPVGGEAGLSDEPLGPKDAGDSSVSRENGSAGPQPRTPEAAGRKLPNVPVSVVVGGIVCLVIAAVTLPAFVHALRVAGRTQSPDLDERSRVGSTDPRGEEQRAARDSDSRGQEDSVFKNDPDAVGAWKALDFVAAPEHFAADSDKPARVRFLKELYLLPGGNATGVWRWTRGRILNTSDGSSASYSIRETEGKVYLFLAWNTDWSAHDEEAGYLVFVKTSFDSKGSPALFDAAQKGDVAKLRKLLALGVNVNAANSSGVTPLHLAAINGHPETVEALVDHGAQVGAADREGRQPLHRAAQKGHRSVAEVLLAAGAELDTMDNADRSPLHLAATNGHQELARMLVDRGADIHAADNTGKSPVEWMAELAQ